MSDKTAEIVLDPPVEWNNGSYSLLKLREPTLDEWEAIVMASDAQKPRVILTKVCGLPPQVAIKVPASAALKALETCLGFIDLPQQMQTS